MFCISAASTAVGEGSSSSQQQSTSVHHSASSTTPPYSAEQVNFSQLCMTKQEILAQTPYMSESASLNVGYGQNVPSVLNPFDPYSSDAYKDNVFH